METDVLIIGSGIAGLSLAIYLARERSDLDITVLTKTVETESNTRYAQGGVAAVWDFETDSYKKHIEDTLDAGDGLCDEQIVELVVKEGPDRVKEIIDWGARFDLKDGAYDLGREGGHSENRILHYKDITGWEIQRTLNETEKKYPNIKVLEHYFAVDLLTQHHLGYMVSRVTPGIECYGVYALNKIEGTIDTVKAKMTILATGGAGQVYRSTTNPVLATGDGIAMVYRAKGRIENMEFVQFHPTSLYSPAIESQAFLVSEAVRGYGAILKTADGEEFMQKYDPRGSLAPRDIVARAIDNEMKIRGADYMLLDCRHLDREGFIEHFPTIYEKCRDSGSDPFKMMIPVVPAAHYVCGGVKANEIGQTSIFNLYSCGECTCSGLHGANRLASNSLLEALVFARCIATNILSRIDNHKIKQGIPDWNARGTTEPNEMVLITQSRKELKEIMSTYVGIVRTNIRLKRAMDRLWLLYRETEELYNSTTLSPQLCELRNQITVGYLVARMAGSRKESRGLHYNTDYLEKNPFKENSVV